MLPVVKEAAENLEKFIETSKNVLQFYDDDADGICSGVILKKYLERKEKRIVDSWHLTDLTKPFGEQFNRFVLEKEIDLIVINDFNLWGFQYFERAMEFMKSNPGIKLVIVDHHRDDAVYDLDNILEINLEKSQNEITGGQYCTSKIAYDLVLNNDPFLAKEIKWVAGIGIIGDSAPITWKDLMKELIDEYNTEFQEEKEIITPVEMEDYFLTPFGKASNDIFYGIAKGREEVSKIFEKMYESKNVYEVLEFLKVYDPIKKEVYDYVENYEYFMKNMANAVGESNIFEVEIKSEYFLTSIVSNVLSIKNPEMIFIVFQKKDDGFTYMSVRNHNKRVHLGKIMEKCAEGFPDSNGGGHAPAAGARVRTENFDDFKEKFYQIVENE